MSATEREQRLEAALREVLAIGAIPRDSMTWNLRECKERGQAMMDAANRGLNG